MNEPNCFGAVRWHPGGMRPELPPHLDPHLAHWLDLLDRWNRTHALTALPVAARREELLLDAAALLLWLTDLDPLSVAGSTTGAAGVHGRRALDLLLEHPWQGNVREMENLLGRAVIHMQPGDEVLSRTHLDQAWGAGAPAPEPAVTWDWKALTSSSRFSKTRARSWERKTGEGRPANIRLFSRLPSCAMSCKVFWMQKERGSALRPLLYSGACCDQLEKRQADRQPMQST